LVFSPAAEQRQTRYVSVDSRGYTKPSISIFGWSSIKGWSD
jgi:hypothetical protein